MSGRTCAECAATVGPQNRTGLCRTCYERDKKRRQRAAIASPCRDCTKPCAVGARRNLCRQCYDRRRRAGTLEPLHDKPLIRPEYACPRCSIPTTAKHGVCKDCRDVIAPEELPRWVA